MNKKVEEKNKCSCTEDCSCGEECNCGEDCSCGEECSCNEECNCTEECNCEACNHDEECDCHEEECCCCDECSSYENKEEAIKALKEEVLKAKAEVINYKRRKDEEVSRLLKYAEEDLASGFLEILDNFERAINMDDDNLDDEVSKFLEGIKMIYGHTKNLLEKHGITEINCLGEKFDPTYHQAVFTDKNKEKDPGTILEVLQKGYMYKDKVLRPAMVKVNE